MKQNHISISNKSTPHTTKKTLAKNRSLSSRRSSRPSPARYTLTLIIVNFNSSFWLSKLLDSITTYLHPNPTLDVSTIVVDNGSTDDSLELLSQEYPWVQVIPLTNNTGFAAANNVALRQLNTQYAMLINSDVEFTPESRLADMLRFSQKHQKVAAITPRVEFSSGELDPACHRGEPTLWASLTYFTKLERLFPKSNLFGQYHMGWKDLATIHSIDACSGAAMLVKRSVIKKIGLLDERFFMYAEDLDWCKRMRDAGYLVVFHPGAKVIHHKYKSGIKTASQKIAKQTRRHFYDTMLQYYDKHYANKYPRFVRWLVKVCIVGQKGAV